MSSLFEVLKKLEADKFSGEISVTSSQGNAELLICEGALLWAHRPIDRAIERLSKFDWIKLPEEGEMRGVRTWEEFVQRLLRSNHESYQQLVRFLKTDRLELFFRIFFWNNVEMTPRPFAVTTPDQAELGFYAPKALSTLLKEAKRRIDEWPKIQKQIGSSKRIFICTVEIPTTSDAPLDLIDEAFLDKTAGTGRSLPYSFEEIEILKGCDGTNSVQDIVRTSADGEFLTLRRILRLWEKGALNPKDDDSQIMHPQAALKKISFKEALRAAILIGIFVLAATTGSKFIQPAAMKSEDALPIQQALEIFRLKNSRYPLTLNELNSLTPIEAKILEAFSYALLNPTSYELK